MRVTPGPSGCDLAESLSQRTVRATIDGHNRRRKRHELTGAVAALPRCQRRSRSGASNKSTTSRLYPKRARRSSASTVTDEAVCDGPARPQRARRRMLRVIAANFAVIAADGAPGLFRLAFQNSHLSRRAPSEERDFAPMGSPPTAVFVRAHPGAPTLFNLPLTEK